MDVYESDRGLEKQSKLGATRVPLVSAENKNGTTRRSRVREVSSRYMSPTPSATTIPKRSQSPIPTRTSSTSALPTTKRALSAERKRPSGPSSPKSPSLSTPIQDTTAEGLLASRKIAGNKLPESLWPSTMRSLSVSFQSDSISVPDTVSKREKQVSLTPDRTLRLSSSNQARKQVETSLSRKPTPERNRSPLKTDQSENSKPWNSSRKPTPERKRSPLKAGQSENSKPVDGLHSRVLDQHRWPSKATGKRSPSFLNKSVDLFDKGSKFNSLVPSRPSTPSLRRLSLDGATKSLQKPSSDLLMQLSSDDSSVRLRKAGSVASSPLANAAANKSVDLSDKRSKVQSLVPSRACSPSLRRLSLDGATKPLQKPSSDLLMQLSSDDSSVRLRKAGSVDSSPLVNAAAKSVDLSDKGSKMQSLVPSRPCSPSLRRLSLDGATKPSQKSSSDLLMQLSSDDSSVRLRKAGSLVSSGRTSSVNAAANKSVDLFDKGSKIQSLVPSRPSSPSLRRLSLDGATKPLQKSSSDLLMQLSADDSSVGLRKAGSLVSSERTLLPNVAVKALSVPSPISVSRPASPSMSRGVSPSRLRLNPSFRVPSPARARPSSPSKQSQSSNSVLSFIADIKGKKASNHIEDVHQLRLLYNRHLQWRYANAQTYAALDLQKAKAEKILYNVWRTIVNLRGSVIVKKTDLQRLKLQLQLFSILNNQLTCLDEWASIERDHTNSVTSTIQDLQASTVRIPVTGGAKGGIETVKAAISSAVDVMQAMGSSLRSVLSRVEAMNTLVSELADVSAHERATLIECELVLGSTTALQVQESSLRTHLLQMKEACGESSSVFGY